MNPLSARPRFISELPARRAHPSRPYPATDVCTVAILGFGTVGRSVAKILSQNSAGPLRLAHIYNRQIARKRVSWLPPAVSWTENIDDVFASDVDIVVELAGGQEAEHWLRRALECGKSVVTANKQLIAHCGPELMELAHRMGRHLAFGASVAGGVPVLSGLQEGLAGDRLHKVCGILNGTCNYVLSQIESAGVAFAEALAKAQELGFAEADPAEDVDGYDARAKLAILTWVGLHASASANEILCRSIREIEAVDFSYAHQLGYTIRQISRAELQDGCLLAAVQPALVPLASPLAGVQGSRNLVMATGAFGGETVFSGHGAGGDPTAVAVVSDLLAIARARHTVGSVHTRASRPLKVSGDFVTPHYVRFTVTDRPGIIAALAAAFSAQQINIDSVLQQPGYPKSRLPFVVALEACSGSVLEKALEQIRKMDFLVQAPVSLPILGQGNSHVPAM